MGSALTKLLKSLTEVFESTDPDKYSFDCVLEGESLSPVQQENGDFGLKLEISPSGSRADFRMAFGRAYFKHSGKFLTFLSAPEREAITKKEVEDPLVAQINQLRWQCEELARTTLQLHRENMEIGGSECLKPGIMSGIAVADEIYTDQLARVKEERDRTVAGLVSQLEDYKEQTSAWLTGEASCLATAAEPET